MAPTNCSIAKRRRTQSESSAHHQPHQPQPQQPHHALPHDALLLAFTFLTRTDVVTLTRVSSSMNDLVLRSDGSAELWRTLALRSCGDVVGQIWESLRGTTRAAARAVTRRRGAVEDVSITDGGGNDNDDAEKIPPPPIMSDSQLWRRILQCRESMLRKPTFDEPNGGALDLHPEFYVAVWYWKPRARPRHMNERYDFTVHLWDEGGEKYSEVCGWRRAHPQARTRAESRSSARKTQNNYFLEGTDDELKLYLDESTTVAELLRSGRFSAMEIEVYSRKQKAASVIYSSPNNHNELVDAYGGSSFEEYASMAWFEYEDEDDGRSLEERRKAGVIPERIDWLPFAGAPNLQQVGSKSAEDSEDWCTSTIQVNFRMEWRCRNRTGRVGEEYAFARRMSLTEVKVFLANRCYGTQYESGKQPRCCALPSGGPNPSLTSPQPDYSPKDITSYSFVIDFHDVTDPTTRTQKNRHRTLFYESAESGPVLGFTANVSYAGLTFSVPPLEYAKILPKPEDYKDGPSMFLQFPKVFTIYVIDRMSGRQAKLFETNGMAKLGKGQFYLQPYFDYGQYAALTRYWTRAAVDGIPVPFAGCRLQPSIQPVVSDSCAEEGENEADGGLKDACRSSVPKIVFWFGFLSRNKNPREGRGPVDVSYVGDTRRDYLTFLEKGLVYE